MSTAGIAPTIVAGGATVLGAFGLYAVRRPNRLVLDVMLGSAAGVMLAAVSFSLLVPALEGEDRWGATQLAVAFVAGAAATWGLQRVLPHEPAGHDEAEQLVGPSYATRRRITLLVAAVAIHNVPEGLAVGIGLGNDPDGAGLALAGGIMVQNLPEGLAVAAALAGLGADRGRAIWLSGLTGVIEIVAGLAGLVLASLAEVVLPAMLAAAAGAMLFVVSHEIVPETHRHGNEDKATAGLVLGFAAMILLDALLT